ncbi:hypothetical protein ACOMHN_047803 [Nucella lapillus]
MSKAANKDSPASSSVASTPGGSACLSSQAATLRVTAEGLNIVGGGKLSSNSQKDQQQKFFATRSANGHWNLLMTRPSDPKRLFLVQPAPGHKFQMTGGTVRMENTDVAADNNSASEASANGCEADSSSDTVSVETSKAVAVPVVAQMRTSTSGHPPSSSQSSSASSTDTSASVSTVTLQSGDPAQPAKRTFFKSTKDRKALKASAEQALGMKTNSKSKKGSKSPGSTFKQGKRGKASVNNCVLNRTPHDLMPSHLTAASNKLPVLTSTPPVVINPLLWSTSGDRQPRSVDSCTKMISSIPSPHSELKTASSNSSREEHSLGVTVSQGPSSSCTHSAGDENCYKNTVGKDTVHPVYHSQQHSVSDEGVGCSLGLEDMEQMASTILTSAIKNYQANNDTEGGKSSDSHRGSPDRQGTEKSLRTAGIFQSGSLIDTAEVGKSQAESVNAEAGKCPKSKRIVSSSESVPSTPSDRDCEFSTAGENCMPANDWKHPKSDAAEKTPCETLKASSGRRLPLAPGNSEFSDGSSDTDDYEFALSDSDVTTEDPNVNVSAHDGPCEASTTTSASAHDDRTAEGGEEWSQDPRKHSDFSTEKEKVQEQESSQSARVSDFHSKSDSAVTPTNPKTNSGRTDSEPESVLGKEVGQPENNISDTCNDVEFSDSTQWGGPESSEESQAHSGLDIHDEISVTGEGKSLVQSQEVNGHPNDERTAEGRSDQPGVCQGETFPKNRICSSEDAIYEKSRKEQEKTHSTNNSLLTAWDIKNTRKRREGCHEVDQNINDILQQKPPIENQASTEQKNPEQNNPKKRKKRKSELENLRDTTTVETDMPNRHAVVVDDKNKEQEDSVIAPVSEDSDIAPVSEDLVIAPVSEDSVIAPVSLSLGQDEGAFRQKKKPKISVGKEASGEKNELKICINLNTGKSTNITSTNNEGPVSDDNSSSLPVEDTAESANDTPATENASPCLAQAEQELSRSKTVDSEALSMENKDTPSQNKEPSNVCSSNSENQDGEIVQIANRGQTPACTKGERKGKKKKKHVKFQFKNSTKEKLLAHLGRVSGSLKESDTVTKSQTDQCVTSLLTGTEEGADNGDQAARPGAVVPQQKKKRKKKLSEVETLIHDQEAFVVHEDTIEERSTQEVDATEKNCTQGTAHEKKEQVVYVGDDRTDHESEITEVDENGTQSEPENGTQSEPEKMDCSVSKRQASWAAGMDMSDSGEVVGDLASGSITQPPSSLSDDTLADASQQKTKKSKASEHPAKKEGEKRKYKKRKKKLATAGVIVMPPAASCTNTDPDCGEKESTESADVVCSFPTESPLCDGPDRLQHASDATDSEDEEARSNRAMHKFLTSRSFSKWELARMFGTPFVVLERLCDQDVYFMSRRFRNARVSGRARCSAHCRLRTLDYLCELNLIHCKPPPIPGQTASELPTDATGDAFGELQRELQKKERKRKNQDGCEKEEGEKKKRKRRKKQLAAESGEDGDVIIVNKASSTAPASQGSGSATSSASSAPVLSFPSASLGRIRIARQTAQVVTVSSKPPIAIGSSQLITAPSLVPRMTSSGPQVYALTSLGGDSNRPPMPQVISLASLRNPVSSANRIMLSPVIIGSTSGSLKDATRASLTQAISNSLGKTRLVTPGPGGAPVVALANPPVSSPPLVGPVLTKGPVVVQPGGVVPQASSLVQKAPIIVTVGPLTAPVLAKGPVVAQTTLASSTTVAAPQAGASSAKQQHYIMVQMGGKNMLLPASALTSTAATPISPVSALPAATPTTCPLLQSSFNLGAVSLQRNPNPVPTVITAPATTARPQGSSLLPGTRIVLSNQPPVTMAPRTGPTASTLLFASRQAIPNQAWSGPRTLDSNRRLLVTPSSQSQGVRMVLSGAGAITSGTRFSVSSSRGGVLVAAPHQPASSVRPASPRQSRPGKKVMTEEERLRKRARLEKKYPLPPGVVIKTESQSRGYSDEGKTTQANSSARVYVSTVAAGSSGRTQAGLTQPIPVLSAIPSNSIIIRQAGPSSSSAPRSSSLLGPLIIRMANASAVSSGLITSSSVTAARTAVAAPRLTAPRVSLSSAFPMYSLLSGNTAVTAGTLLSSTVTVTSSSLATRVQPQTSTASRSVMSAASVVRVSPAALGTSSVPSGSVRTGNSGSQQSDSDDDDAIYIADSPPPVQPTSQSASTACSNTATESAVTSASQETSSVISSSLTSSVPVTVGTSASPVPTTVVYTSQAPVMITTAPTTSSSAPSSRMASLGALWVRQATQSPDSLPAINTSSLQAERLQRLKEMLAKQMENVGDERRQKALQALHQQFCQKALAGNASDSPQPDIGSSENGVDSAGDDGACTSGCVTETGDGGASGQTDQSSEGVMEVDDVSSGSGGEGVVSESGGGRRTPCGDRVGPGGTHGDSIVRDDTPDTANHPDSTTDGDVLMMDSDESQGPQPTVANSSKDTSDPNTMHAETSQIDEAGKPAHTDPTEAVTTVSDESDTNRDSSTGGSGDVDLCSARTSQGDKDSGIQDDNTSTNPHDGDAPSSRVTGHSPMDCTETNSGTDESAS